MRKINWLKNILFIAVPVVAVIIFNAYKSLSTQQTGGALKAPEISLNTDNNKEAIAQLNHVLAQLNSSIQDINKKMDANKNHSDERIRKIENTLHNIKLTNNDVVEQETPQELRSPQEEREYFRERAIQQVASFDAALEEEERDEGWATEMEEGMWIATEKEIYQGSNFSAPSCKSTFCRLEAYHSDEESRDNFESLRREMPNSYHIQHLEEGGELKSVIYFIKEGEEPNNVIFQTLNGVAQG